LHSKLIGVVCKDAGAANQIASYIMNNPGQYIFALQNPATSIFTEILGHVENTELDEVVKLSDEILTGSGWTSDFEWRGIREGRKNNKKVITHLDHWNNYRERFIRNFELNLPEELWVSDAYSLQIATLLFASTKIIRKPDYYLQAQIVRINEIRASEIQEERIEKSKVLFISEPLLDSTELGYLAQIDLGNVLKLEFLDLIDKSPNNNFEIRVRPHPSELRREAETRSLTGTVGLSPGASLSGDLAWADYVVGMDSYALYVADNARIPTVSIASWLGREITIPRGNIKFLQKNDLIELLSAK